MDAVTFIASGADDPAKGYAGPLALAAAVFACYLIWRFDMWWKDRRDPSPTETGAPLPRETPQVSAVSSHVSPDETAAKPAPAGWWGRIENVNGSLRRVYQTARHVTKTGDSPPPDDAIPGAVPDDVVPDDDAAEFDLPLDDDEAGHEGADNGAGPLGVGWTSDDPNIGRLTIDSVRETREEYVSRCIEADVPKPKIVAALQEHYGLSRATAYRVVDGAAERRPAA